MKKKALVAILSVTLISSTMPVALATDNINSVSEAVENEQVDDVTEVDIDTAENSNDVLGNETDEKQNFKEEKTVITDKQEKQISVTIGTSEPKSYDNLGEALKTVNADKSTDKITVKLPEGTFSATANEQFRIDRDNVLLEGQNKNTVLDCGKYTSSGQAGLLITGDNVIVKNMTVKSNADAGSMGTIKWAQMDENQIEGGALYGVTITNTGKGYGLNIHGVKNMNIGFVTVTESYRASVSVANTTNLVFNQLKTAKCESFFYNEDIIIQYKDNNFYKTPVSLEIKNSNLYYNKIKSDRPANANGGQDVVKFDDNNLVKVENQNGTFSIVSKDSSAAKDSYGVTTSSGVETRYVSFNDAIAHLEDGVTITLYKDAKISKVLSVNSMNNVTFDLNGHKILADKNFTGDTTGSEKYLDNLVNIDNSKNITIKNGTLEVGEKNRNTLNLTSKSEVTLENMTVDNSKTKGGSPIIVNSSNMNVEGQLTLKTGDKSWYAMNISDKYNDAVVEFKEGSKIHTEGTGLFANFILGSDNIIGGEEAGIIGGIVDNEAPKVNYDQIAKDGGYEQTLELDLNKDITFSDVVEKFTKQTWVSDDIGTPTIVCDKWVFENGVDGYAAFDAHKLGTYKLRFWAEDKTGKQSGRFDILVTVQDTQNPSVTLNGESKITLERCYDEYKELGAVAKDNSLKEPLEIKEPTLINYYDVDGKLVGKVDKVDNTKLGSYKLGYIFTDEAGNKKQATRIVTVVDTTKPVITLNGESKITLERCYDEYEEFGAVAKDGTDAEVKLDKPTNINYYVDDKLVESNLETIDNTRLGTYKVAYSFTDEAGNTKVATRIVTVVDTTKPVITLNGESKITLERAIDEYKELGAVAKDGTDAEVKLDKPSKINFRDASGEFKGEVEKVDINTVGEYKLVYDYTDEAGNTGIKIRVVTVQDTTAPILTLNGDSKITIDKNSEYVENGALATDDGNIVTELQPTKINYSINGEFVGTVDKVDTSKVGTYKLVYEYTDPYGNKAVDSKGHEYIIRTVEVMETEGTAVLIVNYATKDGKIIASEEFTETAEKGTFKWIYKENYSINPPEGYTVVGYENINKEMEVEILAEETVKTEGTAIVEPTAVSGGENEKPDDNNKPAQTGDNTAVGLLLALMGISGSSLVLLRKKYR